VFLGGSLPKRSYVDWTSDVCSSDLAVNLDHAGSHEVRRFFADNALMWLRDYHFDGLRLDAIHALYDRSAIHFLEFLSSEVDALRAEERRVGTECRPRGGTPGLQDQR